MKTRQQQGEEKVVLDSSFIGKIGQSDVVPFLLGQQAGKEIQNNFIGTWGNYSWNSGNFPKSSGNFLWSSDNLPESLENFLGVFKGTF